MPYVPLDFGLKFIENERVSLVDSRTTLITWLTIGCSKSSWRKYDKLSEFALHWSNVKKIRLLGIILRNPIVSVKDCFTAEQNATVEDNRPTHNATFSTNPGSNASLLVGISWILSAVRCMIAHFEQNRFTCRIATSSRGPWIVNMTSVCALAWTKASIVLIGELESKSSKKPASAHRQKSFKFPKTR